jgi:hypothetical protein
MCGPWSGAGWLASERLAVIHENTATGRLTSAEGRSHIVRDNGTLGDYVVVEK